MLTAERIEQNRHRYDELASGRSVYNYYRDYDPSTGRYIESDPVGLEGGFNPYLYANANPIVFTDPTGEVAQVGLIPVCVANPIACALIGTGAVLMSPLGQEALANAAQAVKELCEEGEDDDDPCDIVLDKGQLRGAGLRGREHEVKADELGTKKNLSKFDLCGCKDGRVVVKAHGCKGPIISVTPYRWK